MRISPRPWTAHHFEPEWITIMAANGRVVCKIPNDGMTDDAELIVESRTVADLAQEFWPSENWPEDREMRESIRRLRAIT